MRGLTAIGQLRVVCLSVVSMLVMVLGALQWRYHQVEGRKQVAIRLLTDYLHMHNPHITFVQAAATSEISAQLLSWIRGDFLVEWKSQDLRWTVNVLTHQVYRWQSLQRQKPETEKP